MEALPLERDLLAKLKEGSIYIAICQRRHILRWHREQLGDNRCWIDDYKINEMVIGAPSRPTYIAPAIGMVLCNIYYQTSRLDHLLPQCSNVILNPRLWDNDIGTMGQTQLLYEIESIQIGAHEFIKTPRIQRTASVYQKLYDLLPEKILADFRLPPEKEFLEGVKPGSGCPNFWQSHKNCKDGCDFHRWGPCKIQKIINQSNP